MFRIKICGVTNVHDAKSAVEAGADAIGLNFYQPSPRAVDTKSARSIVDVLPYDIVKVGVFVNAQLDEQVAIADQLQLDFLQLHGDETPVRLAELAPRNVIRAFRFRREHVQQIVDFLAACQQLGSPPAAILVDACQPGSYGGTGKTADWEGVRQLGTQLSDTNIILAGGLNPINVGAAIQHARPASVDVASGVESSPGKKSPQLMQELVREATRAFTGL